MVLVVTALYALVPWFWNAAYETTWSASSAFTRWRDARPPRPLPLRPGDRERYPRRGFGLVFESSWGERIDTFAGEATKDLCALPDTTIELRLSDAQLDTLYDAVICMRLFDYPEPHPPARGTGILCPSSKSRLVVRAGDATKVLTWESGDWPLLQVSDEWKRLRALTRTVSRMVASHPAYRALPPPSGSYL